MANNPTSPDKLRELAPRLFSRKEIIARAKYGVVQGGFANPDFYQWYREKEATKAQQKASELLVQATQQPEPEELEVQHEVVELQAFRDSAASRDQQDMMIAEARHNLEGVWNPNSVKEQHDELAA